MSCMCAASSRYSNNTIHTLPKTRHSTTHQDTAQSGACVLSPRLDCLIGPGGVCRPVQTAGASSTCQPEDYGPHRPLRPPGARTGLTHPCPKRTIPRPCRRSSLVLRTRSSGGRPPRGERAHSQNALLDLPTPHHHAGAARGRGRRHVSLPNAPRFSPGTPGTLRGACNCPIP